MELVDLTKFLVESLLSEKDKLEINKIESVDETIIQVKVSKNELVISTSDGYINILEIQPPNSKMMNISAFLNGNTINVGNKFV